jgi:hypothetical protein
MKRLHTYALLLAFALGIVSEWFCFPILDGDNQSNIFLGLKSIDYPEAYCFWFHSWPDRLLGEYANHSDSFPDLPQSPAFHAVAMLQWAFLYYLLFLVLRFFYHQTNPRILKITLVASIVLLLVTLHYKFHSDFTEYPRMKGDIEMLAETAGRLRAERDFNSGMLRKFVFYGTNSTEKYMGTNSGPFQIWNPYFVDKPYDISRFALGWKLYGYNQMMQKKYRDSLRQTNTPASPSAK